MLRFKSTEFNSNGGHLIAEASDLGLPAGSPVREFEIETMGQVARFTFNHAMLLGTLDAPSGYVIYWYYESDILPGRVGPMTAAIYND